MKKRITKEELLYKDILVEKYFEQRLTILERKDFERFFRNDLGFRARIEEELSFGQRLARSISGTAYGLITKGITVATAVIVVIYLSPTLFKYLANRNINETSAPSLNSPIKETTSPNGQDVDTLIEIKDKVEPPQTPTLEKFMSDPVPKRPAPVDGLDQVKVYANASPEKSLSESSNKPVDINKYELEVRRLEEVKISASENSLLDRTSKEKQDKTVLNILNEIHKDIELIQPRINNLTERSSLDETRVTSLLRTRKKLFNLQRRLEKLLEELSIETKSNVTTNLPDSPRQQDTELNISLKAEQSHQPLTSPKVRSDLRINPSHLPDYWREALEANNILADFANQILTNKDLDIYYKLNEYAVVIADQNSGLIKKDPTLNPIVFHKKLFTSRDLALECYIVANHLAEVNNYGQEYDTALLEVALSLRSTEWNVHSLQKVIEDLPGQNSPVVNANLLYIRAQLYAHTAQIDAAKRLYFLIKDENLIVFPERVKLMKLIFSQ